MKFARIVVLVCACAIAPQLGIAHPPTIFIGEAEKAVGDEVLDFRKRLAAAARDPAKLKEFYAETFVHTTADARVQKIYGGTNEIMKELIARGL